MLRRDAAALPDGTVEVTAAYRMPILDGACAGSTGPAPVAVVVGDVGTDRLTFAMHSDGMRITLNDRPAAFAAADSPLPGGGSVTPHGNETTVSWPDGTEADVLPIGYWGMRVLLYRDRLVGSGRHRRLLVPHRHHPLIDLRGLGQRRVAGCPAVAQWSVGPGREDFRPCRAPVRAGTLEACSVPTPRR